MRDTLLSGVVVRALGRVFDVDIGRETLQCELRGRLKSSVRKANCPVCVGDRVKISRSFDHFGTIEVIEERYSKISRAAAGDAHFEQVIAANLDQMVIVAAAKAPKYTQGLIDRLMVTALNGNMAPVLCINKMDLSSGDEIEDIRTLYRELGYPVLLTSAKTGAGLDALKDQLRHRYSVLVGQSGVGKSSLLNAMEPALDIKTQSLMAQHDRGKHTTSSITLHPLSFGGYVADTPGIKELGIWGVSKENLIAFFPDLISAISVCRFRNCTHTHEPGCSLKAKIESGAVRRERYESYLSILQSLNRYSEK
jgi:ribosome biogenesis GTPase